MSLRAPASEYPRLAFAADTVYSIDQVLDPADPTAAGSVRTVIRRYVVDTSDCDWQPTKVWLAGR